jgi:hypothetical protein
MKLSELQELLKSFEDKFGDLEIKFYDVDYDTYRPVTKQDFSGTFYDDNTDDPKKINHITIWAA